MTTLAGSAGVSGALNGSGAAASFYNPSGVEVDNIGNVYVADKGNNSIRKITSSGVVTTLLGTNQSPQFFLGPMPAYTFNPVDLSISNGRIYIVSGQTILWAPVP